MPIPEKSHIITLILTALIERVEITDKEAFHRLKNSILATEGDPGAITSIDLIEAYRKGVKQGIFLDSPRVWRVLRKRAVRSLSGVSVISLLTKSWGCPGKCVFCPTYEGLPKSYISDEPAVQRAEMQAFDPIGQIHNRLQSLQMTGNAISKCDVRVIGGTWSVYPQSYRDEFIRAIYDAHTTFSELRRSEGIEDRGGYHAARYESLDSSLLSSTLEEAKQRNETAESRVIGIAIETRPDWVTIEEIRQLRKYGVTRVELGYQTTIDEINERNQRGHGNLESIRATALLKDAGFKVVAHMMPGLLGSTPELDRASMDLVWSDPDFRPDEMKIYPMVVTPHSELETIWRNGDFTPYSDETLIDLMADLQSTLPRYVRLNRMYRDIPASEILAGSKLANLRQLTEARMIKKGLHRHDISAREIRAKGNNPNIAQLRSTVYGASAGVEIFLEYIDPADETLFALLRLRFPSQLYTGETHPIEELVASVIIRELHVFGDQLQIGEMSDGTGQHMGFGKRLLMVAETIVRGYQDFLDSGSGETISLSEILTEYDTEIIQETISRLSTASLTPSPCFALRSEIVVPKHSFLLVSPSGEGKSSFYKGGGEERGGGFSLSTHPIVPIRRISIIAGVGVRGYYQKRGYSLEGEYMVKDLDS